MATILVLHGPNLNLLGTREPETYGSETLAEIDKRLTVTAKKAGHQLSSFQSNAEAEIVEKIQACRKSGDQPVDFIIINPAALTHTSIAVRDALLANEAPCIEVHISNVFQRETFRHQSYVSDIAVGVVSGLGTRGYDYALAEAVATLDANPGE